jgi:hypothetical protein
MQFKEVGGKIQVIAYRGYDKEKKRAVTKMLGSLAKYTFSPSDGLMESLTEEEKTELQSYIEKERQSSSERSRQYAVKMIDSHINNASDSLAVESVKIDDRQAELIWSAMAELQKALRKRGFKKPKSDSQTDEVPDSRQSKLPV